MDFSKPLPKHLWIDNGGELFAQKVVIPDGSLPLFCHKCAIFGHVEDGCPKEKALLTSGAVSTKEWVDKSFSAPKTPMASAGAGVKVSKKDQKGGGKKEEKTLNPKP